MRKGAEWMTRPADDSILELLREYGNLTPTAVGVLSEGDLSQSHVGNRLPTLAKYGMTGRIARGLYYISEIGLAWLDEEVDASELPERDEPLGPEDAPAFVYVTDE
ncbi:PhiH1 repressor [Halopelagius fulvigenes]|uniref:PhiH1 repressor n=1 Tax=Halopelagius fulvigenes TaxID=1198324 RepID=A0ABD5U3J3_9EURY